jgi:magnesium transporter
MIRSIYRAPDDQVRVGLSEDELRQALTEPAGLLWLDIVAASPEQCAHLLREIFQFHPLAVDDALEETHGPKVDDWESYIYIVLHEVEFHAAEAEPFRTHEIDVFLGANFVVTFQSKQTQALEHVWEACERDGRPLPRTAGRLLYRMTDELASGYLPVVERMDDEIDEIEAGIFDSPRPEELERIFSLKRSLPHFRRILSPQREVLNKLARGDYAVLLPEDKIYFRDVYDHFVRLYDITEGLRDLVSGVLDAYLSMVSNRMNEVMKVLTIITTLFMPLAFLSGFFGMNFFEPSIDLHPWTGRAALIATLVAMILMPAGMVWWMRRRAWT